MIQLQRFNQKLSLVLKSIFSVTLGLSLGLGVTYLAGEHPGHVFNILFQSVFGSSYDFGMTLFYVTPLILTGLAVSLAFQSGLFNIGVEGQMTVGTFAAAAFASYFHDWTSPWAPWVAGLVAFSAGAFWGWIPGWLKAYRGSHEVINTMMLNFIAAGLTSWLTLNYFKNPDSQNPETQMVGAAYLFSHFDVFAGAPLSVAFLIALGVAIGVGVLLWKTVWGYEIRAVGQNPHAARMAGIDAKKVYMVVMALSGGVAALVAMAEVFGNAGRFRLGFSPGYGFTGIAVSLLGRNHPLGVVCAAFLFGALHKGTSDLDLETEFITRDLSVILQASIILCVATEKTFNLWLQHYWKRCVTWWKSVC